MTVAVVARSLRVRTDSVGLADNPSGRASYTIVSGMPEQRNASIPAAVCRTTCPSGLERMTASSSEVLPVARTVRRIDTRRPTDAPSKLAGLSRLAS